MPEKEEYEWLVALDVMAIHLRYLISLPRQRHALPSSRDSSDIDHAGCDSMAQGGSLSGLAHYTNWLRELNS